jgi:hypothetical protein
MKALRHLALGFAACGLFVSPAAADLTEVWRNTPIDDLAWNPLAAANANSRVVRGMTYRATGDQIVILSRQGGVRIVTLNPATGVGVTDVPLPASGAVAPAVNVTGGTFAGNMIDADDDSVSQKLYFSNLTTNVSTTNLKVYQLLDPTDATSVRLAFDGTIAGVGAVRVGDTIAVTGSGTGTEIYLGTNGAGATDAKLIRLTTTDGSTFAFANGFTFGGATSPRARLGLSVEGTGSNALILGNVAGAGLVPVRVSPADVMTELTVPVTPGLEAGHSLVGVKTISGTTYVGVGFGNPSSSGTAAATPVANTFNHLYTLNTTTNELTFVDQTASMAVPTSGDATLVYVNDGTGSVAFDTTRNNVLFLSTQNVLGAYAIPTTPSTVDEWNMY